MDIPFRMSSTVFTSLESIGIELMSLFKKGDAAVMKFWISGYSQENFPSVCLFDLDQYNSVWKTCLSNPSYLCFHGPFLFALGEFKEYGTLTSFRFQEGAWVPVDSLRTEGGALCHITTDSSMNFLAGSCWGSGHLFTVRLHPDGTFGPVLFSEVLDDGTGRKSRVHFSKIIGQYLYSVNIELDAIFCFHQENGDLRPASILQLPAGCGPRHFYADEQRQRFYCVTEYSSELLVIDSSSPENLRLLGRYPMLDPGFSGKSTGSTLAVSRDGQDLYCANRGEDTVVHFRLSPEGTPTLSGRYSCHGSCPRHIALLDNDRFVGIANQSSDEVILLERNRSEGTLGEMPAFRIPFASPSFLEDAAFFREPSFLEDVF